ncbi:hypothetical protein HPB50_028549 [Hyalomma asiaticum]|nr:hypothetical protein HPB50_028549 [Hyalomma asiaticum]
MVEALKKANGKRARKKEKKKTFWNKLREECILRFWSEDHWRHWTVMLSFRTEREKSDEAKMLELFPKCSGSDCPRSCPCCSGHVYGPKPPVEGETSCIASSAGNEPLQRLEWSLIAATVPIRLQSAGRHITSASTVTLAAPPTRLKAAYEAITTINTTDDCFLLQML